MPSYPLTPSQAFPYRPTAHPLPTYTTSQILPYATPPQPAPRQHLTSYGLSYTSTLLPPPSLSASLALPYRPAHRSSSPPNMPRAKRAAAAPRPALTPIAPCTGGHCHFHRLRCGHIVKTPLHLAPAACATNCASSPQPDPLNEWGPAPFECPVCIARALSMLWKMDVCNLKKQLGSLSLAEFADWVHRNYNQAWQKRMATSVDRWIPGHRDCQQLRMADRAMVVWKEGEARAPYPIEEYRRLYERREVHAEFWNQQYRDTTMKVEECEAEPGVVYQSVEKEGVHYVN